MRTHCAYCGETVPEEDYDDHLRRAHAEELTAIDSRRLGPPRERTNARSLALYAGVGIVVAVFALGYGLVFLGADDGGSTAAVEPDTTTLIHEHGQLSVQYDDTTVDFNQPQYIEADSCFHFHAYDDAAVWHTHCEDVTIEYALETLGMTVTAETFAVDGQEFDADAGDEISVTVDGEPVDPQEHVLEGVDSVDDAREGAGDTVEIVVHSGD